MSTDPEHIEFVRWAIVRALGMTAPSTRTLVVMTPERLDAAAEAALTATLEYDEINKPAAARE
jgi:hypothetical protein